MHELQRAGFVKLVLEGLATGAVSGFVIGLFRISYSFVNSTLGALFVKHSATPEGIACTACFLLFCLVAAWLCLRHEPLISGSGIPHVELVLRGRLPMPWFRVLWTKFFGTLASLSGGLAVGREGPCIQMGAAIGCGVGCVWHDDHLRPRFLVGGSTAGMAAAFGAPLAGMFFAFEELRTIVTLPMLLFTSLAAFGAWFMVDVVLQLGLVFPLADTGLRHALL
ncbi:MAG: chloride channel protein, partial [Desulfovibrio sp.]|nr:chloride channel protein [Desulfovibrio sp.]